jgi:alkylation response protein AidB-like acyl-CoA dehydrogenase
MRDVAFDWQDAFRFDDLLTAEEIMIRDTARDYARERLMPRILEAHRHERFDITVMHEMAELGFLGATIDGFDCAGINYVSYGLIAREFERVDTSFRSALGVQTTLSMTPIYLFGSQEQRERYLPTMARAEKLGCFGLTEPDHGSDPGSMKSRARRVDGGYLLSGNKTWITHAPIADVMIVWAKDDEGVVRGFILERGMPGLTTSKIEGKFSVRASPTGMILMDERVRPGVAAPAPSARYWCPLRLPQQRALRHLLGRHGRGRILLACLAPVCTRSQAVRASAGRQPVDPEKAGRHADGNHPRSARLPAFEPPARQRKSQPRNGVAAQAQQCGQGARHSPTGTGYPWRQRHLGRISRDPPPVES